MFNVTSSPPQEQPTSDGWKFRTLFGREPADKADRLPPASKEKLGALRSARDDAFAVRKVPYDRMMAVNDKVAQVQARIVELTNGQTGDTPPIILLCKPNVKASLR